MAGACVVSLQQQCARIDAHAVLLSAAEWFPVRPVHAGCFYSSSAVGAHAALLQQRCVSPTQPMRALRL
eukprot:822964-Pelagomonas_calceolata.AAC.7